MTFQGSADDEQLTMLTSILDQYCEQAGMEGTHPAREHFARHLMTLFSSGFDSPDELHAALGGIAKDFQTDLAAASKVRAAC